MIEINFLTRKYARPSQAERTTHLSMYVLSLFKKDCYKSKIQKNINHNVILL